MSYKRGMIQSGWLTDQDQKDSKIGQLATELGATMWTFYNGENAGKLGTEGGGLYWTTEDLKSAKLEAEGDNPYSQKTVLSYRYDPLKKKYYVLENRAFVNQIGRNWAFNNNALSQAPAEYGKPPATVIGTFDTYEQAKIKYNEVKKQHEGNYIY